MPATSSLDVPAFLARILERLAALPRHDAASLRTLRRELSPELASVEPRDVIELATELFRSRAPGSHVIACELILYHGSAPAAVRAVDLRRMGGRMASWGEVDTFAGVAGATPTGRWRCVACWWTTAIRWW